MNIEEIENNIKEKDDSLVETEKIIIEIPKNTSYLSLVCFFIDKDGFNANNQILGIKSIKERKEELNQLETENQKLIEKLEEIRNNLERDGYVGYADEIQEILEIAKGEE